MLVVVGLHLLYARLKRMCQDHVDTSVHVWSIFIGRQCHAALSSRLIGLIFAVSTSIVHPWQFLLLAVSNANLAGALLNTHVIRIYQLKSEQLEVIYCHIEVVLTFI